MEDTVFGKIIRRELPAEIVYEDEETLAFLDIEPVSPGHTLVIPKKAVRNIFDVDDETLAAVMRTVRKISPAVRDSVGAKGVHVNSNHEPEAGQVVFHLHMHIIPRMERNAFEVWPKTTYASEEAKDIAARIRKELS
ncbi:HIT family protein [Patescibacteria group bacterium]|nr:HIT family protein [Patescibacteria group bacterium]MBU2159028.1 HIT family protein [Patescibacteria group bacterium]MBU2220546.1 HIT family protein [Patescibacteria group bacterium]